MAEILPFRALRYDAAHLPVSDLVTQPYDKITPEMQDRYYAASPHNLVRIILGKPQPGDDEHENVYSRAAGYLRDWRAKNILIQDKQPSFYVYSQQFTSPGDGVPRERRSFIALGKIQDYCDNVVFRHEQTLAKPKADRLNLLRATRAHFGQIFMLYSDPAGRVDKLLTQAAEAPVTARDEYGVVHRLWPVDDLQTIAVVRSQMADKKLLIADGHHRYETALAYRNECRAQAGAHNPDAPYEYVMMTFINMDSKDLLILPTHRVVSNLNSYGESQLLTGAEQYFSVRRLQGPTLNEALYELEHAGKSRTVVLLSTPANFYLLTSTRDRIESTLAGLSPRQRSLDVVVLHKILLERILGLSEQSIQNQENITYYRDAAEAVARVRPGTGREPSAQFAFLMNPVRIAQMRDVAFGGEVMPQKSTDFYPKLLSGLTIYALE